MADPTVSESPLESAAGAAGPHVVEAFELLSNEIRLSILLALWENYDPCDPNEPISFSKLYDCVTVGDSGNFTYHLDKLTDRFVTKTDDGYKLRTAGHVIVRAIIAGAGLEETAVSPTEIGVVCNRCGDGQLAVRYQDEAVYITCPECEGIRSTERFPQGVVGIFDFDPAGLAGREPSELFGAGLIKTNHNFRMMKAGVCPSCSGTIDASMRLCEEHTVGPEQVCPHCGTRDSARVKYICTVCKKRDSLPVQLSVVDHPAVIAFYFDHGIDTRWDVDDLEQVARLYELYWKTEHTIVSVDPVRVRVTIPCDNDKLRLTLDRDRTVVNISQTSENQ